MATLQRHEVARFASPLIAKLETRAPISDEDREALYDLYADAREMGARRNIIREIETEAA